jgi:ABC-type uncharacterized transport system permease subunit
MNTRTLTPAMESLLIRLAAVTVAFAVFGIFCQAMGVSAFEVFHSIYRASFSDWYAWQNTLTRATPLMLCGLCTALPARAGLFVIGNEGALVIGGLGAIAAGLAFPSASHSASLALMIVAAIACGGLWVVAIAVLQHYRGVNSVISSLLLNYMAVAVLNHLIEGPMRDSGSLNNPATYALPDNHRLGFFPDSTVHYGLLFGIFACLLAWFLISRTTFGFASKIIGGNVRAAQLAGLGIGRIVVTLAFLGGACAGLAGMAEVAAIQGRANSSLSSGYGYVGILVAFLARHNPAAIVAVSIFLGGLLASGGMLQRAHGLPDATVTVLEGITFLLILWSETLRGRWPSRRLRAS